jgi:predicted phosphohydrolase
VIGAELNFLSIIASVDLSIRLTTWTTANGQKPVTFRVQSDNHASTIAGIHLIIAPNDYGNINASEILCQHGGRLWDEQSAHYDQYSSADAHVCYRSCRLRLNTSQDTHPAIDVNADFRFVMWVNIVPVTNYLITLGNIVRVRF